MSVFLYLQPLNWQCPSSYCVVLKVLYNLYFFFLQLPFTIKVCHISVINLYYKSTHTPLCEYKNRKQGSKTGAFAPPELCKTDCGAVPMGNVCLCPWAPGGNAVSLGDRALCSPISPACSGLAQECPAGSGKHHTSILNQE